MALVLALLVPLGPAGADTVQHLSTLEPAVFKQAVSKQVVSEQTWLAQLSLQDSIELARRLTGGRVLSAVPVYTESTTYYRIKLIQGNGRVVTLMVDASNGQIIEG